MTRCPLLPAPPLLLLQQHSPAALLVLQACVGSAAMPRARTGAAQIPGLGS